MYVCIIIRTCTYEYHVIYIQCTYIHTCTHTYMYVKAVGNRGVLRPKMSFRASCIRSWEINSLDSLSSELPRLDADARQISAVDVNESTSEGSLSRSARRPCSEAEGRRAMAPRVSRQVLNHGRTGPWIPSQLLERVGRSLRRNASDVVRSQFVKFGKARGNAGV